MRKQQAEPEFDLDALLNPEVRLRGLEAALADLRDAFLVRMKCFPCAKWSPEEMLSLQAMLRADELIGRAQWFKENGEPPSYERMRLLIEKDRREHARQEMSKGDGDEG